MVTKIEQRIDSIRLEAFSENTINSSIKAFGKYRLTSRESKKMYS